MVAILRAILAVILRCGQMGISGKGRTVGVPRGLLRFLVLKMISEKPMSGAEIMEEIEKQTGSWKPSPGSIYPLLASLHKKGLTKELPKDELGFKRYSFTEEGRKFLEKQIALGKEFMKKMEFLAPMLVGLDLAGDNGRFRGSKEYVKKLMKSFLFLRQNAEKISTLGMDPEKLAEIVIRAIERNILYVLTHPEFIPLIKSRFELIYDNTLKLYEGIEGKGELESKIFKNDTPVFSLTYPADLIELIPNPLIFRVFKPVLVASRTVWRQENGRKRKLFDTNSPIFEKWNSHWDKIQNSLHEEIYLQNQTRWFISFKSAKDR